MGVHSRLGLSPISHLVGNWVSVSQEQSDRWGVGSVTDVYAWALVTWEARFLHGDR